MPAIASLEDLKVAQRPNLETKIVAANTLLHADEPQFQLILPMVGQIREELEQIRHAYFNARTPSTKTKCRESRIPSCARNWLIC